VRVAPKNRTAALLVVCAAALTAPGRADIGASPQPSLTDAQIAAVDAIGQRSVAGKAAPGVTIAIQRNGATVYARGFGYRNVENAIAPDGQTRYPIGSNTKQFTAAAILLLQDEGKLDVDAPLATYLPEIPHAREVRLRNLLTHSGGYAEYTEIGSFDEIGNRPVTAEQIVAAVDRRPLAFVPGTKRQYSNTGYALLTMVIERVSKMRYADFLQAKIFGPLGMTATYVRGSDDTQPNVATEYQSYARGPWEHALHIDYTWFSGAGWIVSNAADLAKWNAALDGGTLLSKRSLGEMMTPVKLGTLFPGYGFGIIVSKLANGHRMISHGGNTTGSATQDARFPDDHLAIEVLANSGAFGYNSAVAAVYGALVPASATPAPGPSAMPSRPQASKSIPGADPRTIAAARSWLDRAVAGHVVLADLRPDVRARMSPAHLAALRALVALGPRTYKLLQVDRRPPATTYAFSVSTPAKSLLYVYGRDDDGTISGAEVVETINYASPATASPTPIASPQSAPLKP